jgi:hypothetical protein
MEDENGFHNFMESYIRSLAVSRVICHKNGVSEKYGSSRMHAMQTLERACEFAVAHLTRLPACISLHNSDDSLARVGGVGSFSQ